MFFNKKQEALVEKESVKPASVNPALVDPIDEDVSLRSLVGKSVIVSFIRTQTEVKEVFVREVSPSGGMVLLKFIDSRIPKWDLCNNYIIRDVLDSPERVIPPRH